MLKYIGIAVVMIAASGAGILLSGETKRRLRELDGLLLFMQYVLSSLEKAGMSTRQIYSSFSNKALEDAGFLKVLCEEAAGSRGSPWAAASERLNINSDEQAIACEFGGHIGTGALWNQLTYCKDAYHKLSAHTAKEKDRLIKQAEMYKWLGVLSGAMICLVLY